MKSLENVSNSEIKRVIDEYVHNGRNREIMKRRLCDGVCFEPLAEEFGLSVTRIKTVVYKEQDKIFKHLK